MRIDEISSQDLRQSHHESQLPQNQHDLLLSKIESSIKQAENPPPGKPLPTTISEDLRKSLNKLAQLSPLADSVKLLLWKLSYRLWNACVDLSNSASIRSRSPTSSSSNSEDSVSDEDHARLRHVAADILYVAGVVDGVPSPELKSAQFYHKTGVIWHDLRRFELASTCFERAADLVSKINAGSVTDAAEKMLLLDLSLARARTAWESASDQSLAVALLSRAKSLLFGSAEHYKAVANQFLAFGKRLLSKKSESPGLGEALKLMNEALDLYEKGSRAARTREDMVELRELKSKTLRFISAVHLQMGEFEGVIKCVKVLREGESEDRHPSLPVLAMKAWLGLRRYAEAEKELRGMVVNKGVPEGVWVSAVEDYFQAAGTAGAETAKEVFLGLLGRCHVSAGAAVRVAHRVLGSAVGEGSEVRVKVVAELVSDQRVAALFSDEAASKQRKAMHAVLWNW